MLCLGVLLATLVAFGDGVGPQQIEMRLEGYLAAEAPTKDVMRVVDVNILDGPMRKFAVTKLTVDDGSMLGFDVLEAVAPVRPQFRMTGDPALMKKIASAGPKELLKIHGTLGFSDHFLLVSSVETKPASGQTPQAPSVSSPS